MRRVRQVAGLRERQRFGVRDRRGDARDDRREERRAGSARGQQQRAGPGGELAEVEPQRFGIAGLVEEGRRVPDEDLAMLGREQDQAPGPSATVSTNCSAAPAWSPEAMRAATASILAPTSPSSGVSAGSSIRAKQRRLVGAGAAQQRGGVRRPGRSAMLPPNELPTTHAGARSRCSTRRQGRPRPRRRCPGRAGARCRCGRVGRRRGRGGPGRAARPLDPTRDASSRSRGRAPAGRRHPSTHSTAARR